MNVWFDANDTATLTGTSPMTNLERQIRKRQHTATRTAGALDSCRLTHSTACRWLISLTTPMPTFRASIHSKQQYIVFNLPNIGDWGSVLGSQQQKRIHVKQKRLHVEPTITLTAVRQNGGAELSGNFQLSNIGNYMVVRITGNEQQHELSGQAGLSVANKAGEGFP